MHCGGMRRFAAGLTVFAGVAACSGPSPTPNPSFDFSGIDAFWSVVDTLEQDRGPALEQWNRLFATPGYAALVASEFERAYFERLFTIAYMPSMRESLSTELEGRNGRNLRHYLRARELRDALAAQEERLRTEPLCEPALERTAAFLPQPPVDGCPPVSFVIFANDGRGYDPIVIDLLASMTWDIEPFLAHEFHHWLRNRQLAFDEAAVGPDDYAALWTLSQIQAEGIADQIDKAAWIADPSGTPAGREGYAARYRENLAATPVLLRSVDSLLCRPGTEPEGRAAGEQLQEIVPQSGHPTGFYMARAIDRGLGRAALTSDFANPFLFFARYQEAGGGTRTAFSECAQAALSELRRRYERP